MKIRLFTIPNMLTLGNLICGSCATVAALVYGNLVVAFALVVVATLFDLCDGMAARLLNQYSKLGVQLDSLADLVSFGVASAAILYALSANATSAFALSDSIVVILRMAIVLIVAFSALRLARFNIDDSQQHDFLGLPTPANAIFCSSLGILSQTTGFQLHVETISLIALVMALLLISPIRMFSFKLKNFGWSDNKIRYIFLMIATATIAICAIFFHVTYSIPLIIVIYVAMSIPYWVVVKGSTKAD